VLLCCSCSPLKVSHQHDNHMNNAITANSFRRWQRKSRFDVVSVRCHAVSQLEAFIWRKRSKPERISWTLRVGRDETLGGGETTWRRRRKSLDYKRLRCDVIGRDDSHFHVAGALALVLAQVTHVLYGVNRCAGATPDAAHATPDKRLVLVTRCYMS